jgi:hypothetical protein
MSKPKKKIAGVAPPSVSLSSEDKLNWLHDHLLYMRQQLLKIDPDTLDDTLHEKWRNQVNSISLAITKVRNVALAQLNAIFAAELPDLEAKADKLTDALYKHKTANETINTIGDGIGIVAKILKLLG